MCAKIRLKRCLLYCKNFAFSSVSNELIHFRAQNIFHQIWVTSKISYLATSVSRLRGGNGDTRLSYVTGGPAGLGQRLLTCVR